MILETEDDQLMAMAAHRYCLGRSSYIVGACLDWLRRVWPQLKSNSQHVILRDTVDAIVTDCAGNDVIDVPGWKDAARWMAADMSPERLQRVRDACNWRGPDRVRELLP